MYTIPLVVLVAKNTTKTKVNSVPTWAAFGNLQVNLQEICEHAQGHQ